MKTPAVISALTVVGSIAFAAGQSQTSRVIPVEEKPLEGEIPPMMALGGSGSCDLNELPEEQWFAPELLGLESCPSTGTFGSVQGLGVWGDVNGDGTWDFFRNLLSTNPSANLVIRDGGQVVQGWALLHSRTSNSSGTASDSFVGVLRKELLGQLILERYPQTWQCIVSWNPGFRDFDGDGDLDLGFSFQQRESDGAWLPPQHVWLENIGYEKPNPPLAADLNQDGSVDGIDLGMLLAAWTLP